MGKGTDQNTARQGDLRKYLIHIGQCFAGGSGEVRAAVETIKQRLRANPRDPRLDGDFETLYKAIVAVERPRGGGAESGKLLAQLLDNLMIPGELTSAAIRLSSKLQRRSKPDSRLLEDYAEFLNQCMQAGVRDETARPEIRSPQTGGEALGRLLAGLSDESELNREIQDTVARLASLRDEREQLNELDALVAELRRRISESGEARELDSLKSSMLRLLDAIKTSGESAERARTVKRQLQTCRSLEDYAALSSAVAALVTHVQSALRREVDELAGFLRSLSERLEELSDNLVELASLNDSADRSHRDLDQRVRREVRDLSDEVTKSTSIAELKATVEAGLSGLEDRIQSFVMEELERTHHSVQAAQQLRQKVNSLESETQQLKVKIEEETTRSQTDALTGIANRLAYTERAEQEFQRWQRYGTPLSIALIDVDHFKQINDSLGHDIGDRVLRAIAQELKAKARSVDFVARFGGEEFVVLLPNTDLAQARCAADKLRAAIDELLFKHNNDEVPVTVSAGVAGLQPGDDFDMAVKRADKALYRAKHAGRNRCEAEGHRSAA